MNKNELKELIKVKESELKALKQQLKELQEAENKEVNTIQYADIHRADKETIKSLLNALDIKQIKKVARQGNINNLSSSKEKAVNCILEIIEARQNKGNAFK